MTGDAFDDALLRLALGPGDQDERPIRVLHYTRLLRRMLRSLFWAVSDLEQDALGAFGFSLRRACRYAERALRELSRPVPRSLRRSAKRALLLSFLRLSCYPRSHLRGAFPEATFLLSTLQRAAKHCRLTWRQQADFNLIRALIVRMADQYVRVSRALGEDYRLSEWRQDESERKRLLQYIESLNLDPTDLSDETQ